jgi:hypothetical protein
MVAIQVPQYEPEEWFDPDDDRRRHGLDVGIWPDPPPPQRAPRRLPDRATRIRRRRLALVLVVATVVLTLTALLRATAPDVVGSDDAPRPISESVYIVQPGDTLWTIAERLAPGKDPRPIVAELRQRHGASELEVGDRLDLAEIVPD